MTIGQPVSGANSNAVLITDGTGNLSDIVHGSAGEVLSWNGANFAWVSNGTSPITIENGDSLFSTGLAGAWNSTATLSIILGVNAGDNADAATSLIALGELAGASDNVVSYVPNYATMIGNRSGYNAHSAIDATFIGHLAGAYASNASYSFFAGAQAGISATYGGNSFFFGQAAGHNATNASASIFMGLEAGYDAANASNSNFLGYLSGFQATNANNSTFIGAQSGYADTVDNRGTITYTGASGTFLPSYVITASGGGTATVLSDNGAGTLRIANSNGTFTGTITQATTGVTATISTYTPSTASILIGDYTSTGGGVNSVAIGARATNAGFDNSIVIGVGGANDANNQYAWGDSIINWKFGGNNYQLPFYLPSGTGQYLGASPGGVLNWSVPGTATNSVSVLAATVAVLPFTPTYANGAGGVGATLTAGSNGALIVDGITIPLNGRVLVKDQVAQLQNGIYQLSTVGDGGTPYVLTRTTDSDMAADFDDQVVIPAQGTQSATPFGQQNVVTNIGTDPIAYATQTDIFVRQQTSGTQSQYNIPFYTSVSKTISKGSSKLQYNPLGIFSAGGSTNSVNFVVDDVNQLVYIEGFAGTSNEILDIDLASGIVTIGDVGGAVNGTKIVIDDMTQLVTIANVPTYANDAAATGAGLTTGQLYKTTTGGITALNIVP